MKKFMPIFLVLVPYFASANTDEIKTSNITESVKSATNMVGSVNKLAIADKLDDCKKITDDKDLRLQCYDDSVGFENTSEAKESDDEDIGVRIGNWRKLDSKDPLTDEQIHLLAARAENGEALLLRCRNNKTEVLVNFGAYLGTDGIRATYRFDQDKAITNTWDPSSDGTAIFYPSSNVKFIKEMIGKKKFIIRAEGYSKSITATFDVEMLEDAVADLRKTCNW